MEKLGKLRKLRKFGKLGKLGRLGMLISHVVSIGLESLNTLVLKQTNEHTCTLTLTPA